MVSVYTIRWYDSIRAYVDELVGHSHGISLYDTQCSDPEALVTPGAVDKNIKIPISKETNWN